LDYLLWRCLLPRYAILIRWHLGDLSVLTVCAFKIASHRSDGKRACSRIEIEKRLLLYGIDVSSDNLSIDQTVKTSTPVFANAADTSPATVNYTAMIT
jgi:hypothetical protein